MDFAEQPRNMHSEEDLHFLEDLSPAACLSCVALVFGQGTGHEWGTWRYGAAFSRLPEFCDRHRLKMAQAGRSEHIHSWRQCNSNDAICSSCSGGPSALSPWVKTAFILLVLWVTQPVQSPNPGHKTESRIAWETRNSSSPPETYKPAPWIEKAQNPCYFWKISKCQLLAKLSGPWRQPAWSSYPVPFLQ